MMPLGRSSHASLRASGPRDSRRVFWAAEQGGDGLDARVGPAAAAGCNSMIEITLADGIRVRVDNNVDATALRRVLDALRGR